MLAAWRFPCCVMEALSNSCEPRGIIYAVVRNQDSWTHGVYSTLLSCCPLKSMELNYIVYVAFTQSPRGRLEPADGQLCLLLYFPLTCNSISRKIRLHNTNISCLLVAHCLLQLSNNTISILEQHPPSYFQSKHSLSDKNFYLHLSDCFPKQSKFPLTSNHSTLSAHHSIIPR